MRWVVWIGWRQARWGQVPTLKIPSGNEASYQCLDVAQLGELLLAIRIAGRATRSLEGSDYRTALTAVVALTTQRAPVSDLPAMLRTILPSKFLHKGSPGSAR